MFGNTITTWNKSIINTFTSCNYWLIIKIIFNFLIQVYLLYFKVLFFYIFNN